jgi:hypothetical protein
MKWILFLILTVASAQDFLGAPQDTASQAIAEEVEDCQRGVKDLKNDMMGLELFLQDKKDYKEYCPQTSWLQPSLEKYKEDPRSYLPEACKAEEE